MKIVSINVHYQDGLGYQDYYLGKSLKKMGHDVHFISSDWHFRYPDYENTVQSIIGPRFVGTGTFVNDYGCKVHRIKGRLIGSMYWLTDFIEKIEELKPDLIISHGVFTFQSVRLSFLHKRFNCPIIYDDHTTSTFYRTGTISRIIYFIFRQFFAKRIYKSAKKIVGISASCIDVLKNIFGIQGEKVQMIPLGADTDNYFPNANVGLDYRKEIGVQEEDILIVYTGKIYDLKRLHVIFEVLNELEPPVIGQIVFHVVGDIAKNYQDIFDDCKVKFKHRLIYRKAVDQKTLAKIYNAADFCIWLDFTNSTIEASACGCPIIVTDLMPERVKNNSGILVDRDNKEQIKSALNLLMKDSHLRHEMSVKSSKFVKKDMSWNAHALKFLFEN